MTLVHACPQCIGLVAHAWKSWVIWFHPHTIHALTLPSSTPQVTLAVIKPCAQEGVWLFGHNKTSYNFGGPVEGGPLEGGLEKGVWKSITCLCTAACTRRKRTTNDYIQNRMAKCAETLNGLDLRTAQDKGLEFNQFESNAKFMKKHCASRKFGESGSKKERSLRRRDFSQTDCP